MSIFSMPYYIGLSMCVVVALCAILFQSKPSFTLISVGAKETAMFVPLDGPAWRRNAYLNTYNRQAWRAASVVLDVTEMENSSTLVRVMLIELTDASIKHLLSLNPKRI